MFAGIGIDEVISYLKSRNHVSAGSVRHVIRKEGNPEQSTVVCKLGSTELLRRSLREKSPRRSGFIQIIWPIGENFMFSLEFPRHALRFYREDRELRAKVRVAQVRLSAQLGSVRKRVPLSACPGFIYFGADLSVIPFSLYQAAKSYVHTHTDQTVA